MARTSLTITSSGQLVRTVDECKFIEEAAVQPLVEGMKTLAYVELENGGFIISPESEPHWLIVRKARNGSNGFKLTEGDVVRLGRVKFRVKEIFNPFVTMAMQTNISMDLRPRSSLSPSKDEPAQPELQAQAPCRICLTDTYTKNNPLMTPCKCAGTMRYIHLQCLQQWLGSKMTMRQSGNTVSYSWKHLECELCKEPFPLVISLDGRVVELVEMHKPDTPYLILEDEHLELGRSRGLHVVSLLENSSVRMGRGHESDLRISDISVSRCHAIIQLTREGFFITDNKSKFGTLLLARKPIRIRDYQSISLQVNRTVLTFQLKQPWKFLKNCFSCCGRGSSSVTDDPQPQGNSESRDDEAAVIAVAEAINPLEDENANEQASRRFLSIQRQSDGLGETARLDEVAESAELRGVLDDAERARAMTSHMDLSEMTRGLDSHNVGSEL